MNTKHLSNRLAKLERTPAAATNRIHIYDPATGHEHIDMEGEGTHFFIPDNGRD